MDPPPNISTLLRKTSPNGPGSVHYFRLVISRHIGDVLLNFTPEDPGAVPIGLAENFLEVGLFPVLTRSLNFKLKK